jgi:hypothetical protein
VDSEFGSFEIFASGAKGQNVGALRFAQLERGGADPVAMADFDDRNASGIRGFAIGTDLFSGELMLNRVIAVP